MAHRFICLNRKPIPIYILIISNTANRFMACDDHVVCFC